MEEEVGSPPRRKPVPRPSPLPSPSRRNSQEASIPLASLDGNGRNTSENASISTLLNKNSKSSASITPSKHSEPGLLSRTLHYWWSFEIFAAVLSIGTFTAIICILAHFDGKIAHELGNGITLNGLISVLSTGLKEAFMIPICSGLGQSKWTWFSRGQGRRSKPKLEDLNTFDEASRGWLGSSVLLYELNCWHLASLGALVTILSLGTDFFVQQSLSTGPKVFSTILNDGFLIFHSNTYNGGYNDANDIVDSDLQVDWPVFQSILQGITTPNLSDLLVKCPTGNCTWPTTPSLAVCGGCVNTTFTTSPSCTGSAATASPASYPTCTYTLPDGTEFKTIPDSNKNHYANKTYFQLNTTADGTHYPSNDSMSYIINFQQIGVPFESDYVDEAAVFAQECALWYCVQAYNTTIVNNINVNTNVQEWSETKPMVGDSDINVFINIPGSFNVAKDTEYIIFKETVVGAHASFERLINENNGINAYGVGEVWQYPNVLSEVFWWNHDGNRTDALVSNIARSMTNEIRLGYFNTTQDHLYAPTQHALQIIVVVRWAWLIGPAALLLTTVVFLLWSIWQTRRRSVKPWKSSQLAVLFSGVEKELREEAKDGHKTSDGFGEVGKKRVVLQEDDGLWEFREIK